jgi:hypothetical protein
MVEPPNVKMIGYNRSTTEPMRVVTFYVSDPDTPFLDPIFMSASGHQRRSDCAPITFGLAWQATRHNVAGDLVSNDKVTIDRVRQVLKSNGIDVKSAQFSSYQMQPMYE